MTKLHAKTLTEYARKQIPNDVEIIGMHRTMVGKWRWLIIDCMRENEKFETTIKFRGNQDVTNEFKKLETRGYEL